MSENDCLGGIVTKEAAMDLTDAQWRALQFEFMVGTEKRLKKLEDKMSWRNILTTIPWALVGGLMGVIATVII